MLAQGLHCPWDLHSTQSIAVQQRDSGITALGLTQSLNIALTPHAAPHQDQHSSAQTVKEHFGQYPCSDFHLQPYKKASSESSSPPLPNTTCLQGGFFYQLKDRCSAR